MYTVLIPEYLSFHFSFGPPLHLTIQEKIYEFSANHKDQRLADYYTLKRRKLGIFLDRDYVNFFMFIDCILNPVNIRIGFLKNKVWHL